MLYSLVVASTLTPSVRTCWLVMVTHCRRSLLIRYSKASSSLTSHLDELQGVVVPLAIGTCCRFEQKDRELWLGVCVVSSSSSSCKHIYWNTTSVFKSSWVESAWKGNKENIFLPRYSTCNLKWIVGMWFYYKTREVQTELNHIFYPPSLSLNAFF